MLTRGPLPSSVYWRRRLAALSVAVVLVVVIAKLLSHGGSGGGHAVMQADQATAGSTSVTPSAGSSPTGTPAPSVTASVAPSAASSLSGASGAASSGAVVATGICQPADVVVTPSVSGAVVGQPVTITLRLQTRTEPACLWRVGPSTMQVKVVTQDTRIWSTAYCPAAIAPQQMTLSNDAPTTTTVLWRGHISDGQCTSHTPWAAEGSYSVTATALGGTPQTADFRLGVPTVIVTVTPTPTSSAHATTTSSPRSTASPSRTPTRAPRPTHTPSSD